MPKKRKSRKKSLLNQKTHLSEALKDLNKELRLLSRQKISFEKSLKKNREYLIKTQNTEKTLRDKISKLVSKEERINEKREGIRDRISKVKDKIIQVNKIKDELRSV